MKKHIKATLLLFTTLLLISCSSDDGDDVNNNDDIFFLEAVDGQLFANDVGKYILFYNKCNQTVSSNNCSDAYEFILRTSVFNNDGRNCLEEAAEFKNFSYIREDFEGEINVGGMKIQSMGNGDGKSLQLSIFYNDTPNIRNNIFFTYKNNKLYYDEFTTGTNSTERIGTIAINSVFEKSSVNLPSSFCQ